MSWAWFVNLDPGSGFCTRSNESYCSWNSNTVNFESYRDMRFNLRLEKRWKASLPVNRHRYHWAVVAVIYRKCTKVRR